MRVLVCYDVANTDSAGARRLRRIAEACKDHGVRVQFSLFECQLEDRAWVTLRHRRTRPPNYILPPQSPASRRKFATPRATYAPAPPHLSPSNRPLQICSRRLLCLSRHWNKS